MSAPGESAAKDLPEARRRQVMLVNCVKLMLLMAVIYAAGYCCAVFSECAGEAMAFRFETAGANFPSTSMIGSACGEDWLQIEGETILNYSYMALSPIPMMQMCFQPHL